MTKRVELQEVEANSIRLMSKSWLFVGALFYVPGVFFFIMISGGVSARLFGVTPSIETMLIDMVVLIGLPIGLLMFSHFRTLEKRQRAARQNFIEAQNGETLVVDRYNQWGIYRVTEQSDAETQVCAVWNTDGPIQHGDTFTAKNEQFLPFDPKRFLDGYRD